jgi:hypothetical protein
MSKIYAQNINIQVALFAMLAIEQGAVNTEKF